MSRQSRVKQAKKETEAIKDQVASERSKENIEKNELAGDISAIGILQEKSSDNLKLQLELLKEKVKEVLPRKSISVADDIQKGRWGGKSENNGRKIQAFVTQSKLDKFYDITITMSAIESVLVVPVAIFVHNSFGFPNDAVYVNPNSEGKLQITVTSYEAFTVGALFADGTELELDLNEQSGYPEGFYW